MNAMGSLFMIGACIVIAAITGCSKQPEIASSECAELGTTTSPSQRAELVKKCPRSGPDFKPSPRQSY